MLLKGIIFTDFVNFKEPSMVLEFPFCSFKCDKEFGSTICQNSCLAKAPNIYIDTEELVDRYLADPFTTSIVCQGLEPFDSFEDLESFIKALRAKDKDSYVVIYTGYNKNEIENKLTKLKNYDKIIIKYGRYIPNQESHYDEVLGVNLASDNQYAEVLK